MKLPVIGGRGAASSEALIRAVRKGAVELSRAIAGAEEALDGGVAFITPGREFLGDTNAFRDVHLPAGSSPAEVLSRVATEFRSRNASCAMLVPTETRLDDSWHALLIQQGFAAHRQSLLHLGTVVEPEPDLQRFQVISARAVPADYREFLKRHFASRGVTPNAAREASDGEAGILDIDALDVLTARHNGRLLASVGVLTVAEFGLLRGLRVESGSPSAAVDALMWHLLDLCKRSQFRQLVAAVNEDDRQTLDLLGSIGMKQIATIESYIRPGIETLS